MLELTKELSKINTGYKNKLDKLKKECMELQKLLDNDYYESTMRDY